MNLILFDFDGTLTRKDSLFEIAKFSNSNMKYQSSILSLVPVFLLMTFKLLSKQKGKEIFLKKFFGKMSETEFNNACKDFAVEKIPSLLREKGIQAISDFKERKYELAIVSASPENWIKPWAEPLGIGVIATRLKFKNDLFEGIDGKNCNGQEKIKRIKEVYDLQEFDKIIAYGDSKGDIPMLALADEKHYKPFRK